MRDFINIVSETLGSNSPAAAFADQHGTAILADPALRARFVGMARPEKRQAASQTLARLADWMGTDRILYRVVGIADWQNEHGDDQSAAQAWASGPVGHLGCYWSMTWVGDHRGTRGGIDGLRS